MAEDTKPTFHHMNNSQSMKILWLLCELDIPFNLRLHKREKSRSPPELRQVHFLGKSPTLVTSQGRVIIESGTIASYLLTTYDADKKLSGDNDEENDWIRDMTLSDFASSSLGPLTTLQLTFEIISTATPFFLRPLTKMIASTMWHGYLGAELKKSLKYLDMELEGRDYFMGKKPGKPDFMLSWPLDMIEQRGWLGDLKDWPRVKEWRTRCHAREGWKEAVKRGNGYDLKKVERG